MAQRVHTFLKQHSLAVLFSFCILFGCCAATVAAFTFQLDHTRIIANSPSDFSEIWSLATSSKSSQRELFPNQRSLSFTTSTVLTDHTLSIRHRERQDMPLFQNKKLKNPSLYR
ncbi:MAG: hypothetical protein ACOYJR_08300 [Acutalibacteraceae bacterium]|jgi:hypothetical protein